MEENGTQNTQSTQVVQPQQYSWLSRAELGEQKSGLDEEDVGDVICVLIPQSPAAQRVVVDTAMRSPEHVLNIERFHRTTRLRHLGADVRGIALRLSSKVIHPYFGFTFGRNPRMCDIVLDHDSKKRISNMHFRVYVHSDGFVMLEDMSTNGTVVDGHHIRATKTGKPATRLLDDGCIIRVGSESDWIDFKVCLPIREDEEDDRFLANLQQYRENLPQHEQRNDEHAQLARQAYKKSYQFAVTENRQKSTFSTTGKKSIYGMHWSGKPDYTVVGRIGQGAFATVYKLASRSGGELFACKELDKRRFIKDGRVDMRLENELLIMKAIRHVNVVNFVDYHEEDKHLYIIMEYVPSGDLQGYLAEHGILEERRAQAMSSQVLQALVYLHKRKITHRDIKPDNILIASYEPFIVKLTDFGLSKVVKNNETFLKTFCGTLLYCAPEVFPDWETLSTRHGAKRRLGTAPPKTFHSYSHSVDVWSYAAVLYYALCGKFAFEGAPDRTGYLMLKKILETPVDPAPLRNQNVSEAAIDLVLKMLTKDPSKRPTDRECLSHRWLANSTVPVILEPESDLESIAEEDEGSGGGEHAEAFSQLSLADKQRGAGAQAGAYPSDGEVEFDEDDMEFLGMRAAKRVKPDRLIPRNQIRDNSELLSSSIEGEESAEENIQQKADRIRRIPHAQRPGRLFGEIDASALRSSGVLLPRSTPRTAARGMSADHSSDELLNEEDEMLEDHEIPQLDGHGGAAAASLFGAESMVGQLNVHSPESAVSPEGGTNEPETPKTPEVSAASSHDESTQGPIPRPSQEITPKPPVPPKFSRRINIPLPASLYSNEHDPSTHNLEYASKVSGHDYVSEAANGQLNSNNTSIPQTMHPSLQRTNTDSGVNTTPPPAPVIPMAVPAEYLEPQPRLGLLVSTTDSFAPIFLRLQNKVETWGRDPKNTLIYPNIMDSRISKRAFAFFHHAWNIEKKEKAGQDWTTLPGLHTLITTCSSVGIWVNGVRLMEKNSNGEQLTGRIHSGDVITVFDTKNKGGEGECLKFVCTFYHGEAAKPRTAPFEVLSVKE